MTETIIGVDHNRGVDIGYFWINSSFPVGSKIDKEGIRKEEIVGFPW